MTHDMTKLQVKKLEEEHEQALLDLERLLEALKSEVKLSMPCARPRRGNTAFASAAGSRLTRLGWR